jgi:predicted alpha/beta superfamily hydrolase
MSASTPHSPSRRRLLATATAVAGVATLSPARAANGWQSATLTQALQREITSTITGQRYRIFVSIPTTPAPPGGHPVLYALDGNATFPTLALLARLGGNRSRAEGHVPPVVVGIGYATDQYYSAARGRDYTPPSGEGAPVTEGGADLFLDFVERELKPLVATLAPLDPARQALYGHSYGGLFTLYALFTRPASFQTYLAASPSIWYRDRAVLANAPGFAKRVATLPVKPALMLTAGALEQPVAGTTPLQGQQAIAAQRRMVDEARELAGRLQAADALARVQFHLLAHENHGSAMFPAMARGLEFFLD